jgi:AcrR family transcriptional regulator
MPKVSDAYKEERRAALLDSALHCFAEKGYAATTIDDIVRHAKVSKGAIYNYFKSKEEIFLQILENRNDTYFAELRRRFEMCPDASSKLRHLIARFRDLPKSADKRSWGLVNLEFWLYASRQELDHLIAKQYEMFIKLYHEILEEGKRRGEFRADLDVAAAASLFLAMRDGMNLHLYLILKDSPYERTLEEMENMLFQYLKGK